MNTSQTVEQMTVCEQYLLKHTENILLIAEIWMVVHHCLLHRDRVVRGTLPQTSSVGIQQQYLAGKTVDVYLLIL